MNRISKAAIISVAVLVPLQSAFSLDRTSDSWKEATINARYNANDILDNYDIEASVEDSEASLTGKVSSDIEKELAEVIAKNVDGVTSVENKLVIDDQYTPTERKAAERSIGQKISDATTTAKVKSRFFWNSNIPAKDINVDTTNNVVTLKGAVPMASQKELAEKLAFNTDGVSKVMNQLTVTNPPEGTLDKVGRNVTEAVDTTGETLSDIWIDTKVTANLNFTRSISINDLSVESNNGVVTINGFTYTPADKELAGELAKEIRGVKKVINNVNVI